MRIVKVLASPPEVAPACGNLWAQVDAIFVRHPTFLAVHAEITKLLPLHGTAKALPCVPFVGPSGIGKSTIFDKLRDAFPSVRNARHLLLDDGTEYVADHVPVIFVRMPSKPGAIALLRRLLAAMGDPLKGKGNRETLEERFDTLVPACGTKLVVVDEAQRLVDRTGALTAQDVVDCIKDRHEVGGVSFVMLSLPRIRWLFEEDDQIDRRWAKERSIQPYRWGPLDTDEKSIPESRDDFVSLLAAFRDECPLPFAEEVDVESDDVALRFYYVSSGIVGRVKILLKAAMLIAVEQEGGPGSVDFALLSAAFQKEFRAERKERVLEDPFAPGWRPCLPPALVEDIGRRGRGGHRSKSGKPTKKQNAAALGAALRRA